MSLLWERGKEEKGKIMRSSVRGFSGSLAWKEDRTAEQVGHGTWQSVAAIKLPKK